MKRLNRCNMMRDVISNEEESRCFRSRAADFETPIILYLV